MKDIVLLYLCWILGVGPMIVSLSGKILTDKMSDSQDTDDVSSNQMISRLSVGGELCDPWNETSLYVLSSPLYCHPFILPTAQLWW